MMDNLVKRKYLENQGQLYVTRDIKIYLNTEAIKNREILDNYCLIGYFNEDESKFKDVRTGEVYLAVDQMNYGIVSLANFVLKDEYKYERMNASEKDKYFIINGLNCSRDISRLRPLFEYLDVWRSPVISKTKITEIGEVLDQVIKENVSNYYAKDHALDLIRDVKKTYSKDF